MELEKMEGKYKIVKVDKDDSDIVSTLYSRGSVFSIVNEVSCTTLIMRSESENLDASFFCEDDWVSFKVAGQLSFDLSGILLSYLSPLAEGEISVLVTSSFDTDYIFVKEQNEKSALNQWRKSGILVASNRGESC
jgi:hypothetical protein